MSFIVAIDGPTSSGKSTVSKLISNELNFTYIQTGAMYRCVAMEMLNNGIALDDEKGIKNILDNIDIKFENLDQQQLIFCNGKEVTDIIRSKQVTDYTSSVASIIQVRRTLLEKQREIAQKRDVIMEGRDIGSNVFPNADVKIFLTASPLVRAERRRLELKKNGEIMSFTKVLESIYKWDEDAIKRTEGPLVRTKDYIYIDNSELDIQELKEKMLPIIKYRYNEKENCR